MTDAVEWYDLERITVPPRWPGGSRLASAAVLECGLCGRVISGMGGSGEAVICIPCGDALKRGGLRGAVKWDEAAP